MEQRHPIIDPDSHFIINPDNRRITTTATDLKLIQGDFDSERITFEIPEFVEGHPMIDSDKIEVHFVNIDRKTKEESRDVYFVDDAILESGKVIFSWLISPHATKYYGVLYFLIAFNCYDGQGNYTYRWNTEVCKLLKVGPGMDNKPGIIEDYPDAFEQLKIETVLAATKDTVKTTPQELTEEQKNQVRKNLGIENLSGLPEITDDDVNKVLFVSETKELEWSDDIVINGGKSNGY